MRRRSAILVMLMVLARPAGAGHGFMNSFADVEWLPDPGCTPDRYCYVFDTFAERCGVFFARFGDDSLEPILRYAREKLAETSAMLKANDPAAATVALERYLALAATGEAALDDADSAQIPDARQRYMLAVLEHVYIMSVDYVDLPLDVRRTVLVPFFDGAMEHFASVRAALGETEQKALFFREEEIRWSLEMTEQADVQKITNEFATD